jgi:hypothetical protein
MKYLSLISIFFLFSLNTYAQDDRNTEDESTSAASGPITMEGFHAGFFAGAFIPHNFSASLYDGRGVDTSGFRNNFVQSVMVQRMILNGMDSTNSDALDFQSQYPDLIAQALGVDHDQWDFNSDDMPSNMKYSVAFLFGLDLQYGISKTEGIIFNANFARLNASGSFTITIPRKVNPSLGDSILYFGVIGQEQRLMLQLGYSRIFGPPSSFNFLLEGGLLMNSAKFLSNTADINGLKLDLTPFTFNQGYSDNYLPVEYNSIGFGGFAGIGGNINLKGKYIIQFLYSPSYEKINIGAEPAAKLQQSAGLRMYYNF